MFDSERALKRKPILLLDHRLSTFSSYKLLLLRTRGFKETLFSGSLGVYKLKHKKKSKRSLGLQVKIRKKRSFWNPSRQIYKNKTILRDMADSPAF